VLYEYLIVYEYNYYIEKEYLGSMEILKLILWWNFQILWNICRFF